jgi:hypothetical protein
MCIFEEILHLTIVAALFQGELKIGACLGRLCAGTGACTRHALFCLLLIHAALHHLSVLILFFFRCL